MRFRAQTKSFKMSANRFIPDRDAFAILNTFLPYFLTKEKERNETNPAQRILRRTLKGQNKNNFDI